MQPDKDVMVLPKYFWQECAASTLKPLHDFRPKFLILYTLFQSQKSITHFRPIKLVHGFNMNGSKKWLHLCKHMRRSTNLPMFMRKKNSSRQTKYPRIILSQSEKHNLFQNKMIKTHTLCDCTYTYSLAMLESTNPIASILSS